MLTFSQSDEGKGQSKRMSEPRTLFRVIMKVLNFIDSGFRFAAPAASWIASDRRLLSAFFDDSTTAPQVGKDSFCSLGGIARRSDRTLGDHPNPAYTTSKDRNARVRSASPIAAISLTYHDRAGFGLLARSKDRDNTGDGRQWHGREGRCIGLGLRHDESK